MVVEELDEPIRVRADFSGGGVGSEGVYDLTGDVVRLLAEPFGQAHGHVALVVAELLIAGDPNHRIDTPPILAQYADQGAGKRCRKLSRNRFHGVGHTSFCKP